MSHSRTDVTRRRMMAVSLATAMAASLTLPSSAADTQSNVPPQAVPDDYTSVAGTALQIPAPGVLSNDRDPDGDPLTAILIMGTAHGSLTLVPDGALVYLPSPGFTGTDSFEYAASDAMASSDPAVVTIEVKPLPGSTASTSSTISTSTTAPTTTSTTSTVPTTTSTTSTVPTTTSTTSTVPTTTPTTTSESPSTTIPAPTSTSNSGPTTTTVSTVGEPPPGAVLYATYCSACHGMNARGSRFGSNIRSEDAGKLARFAIKGPGKMPSFAGVLDPYQIELIARYVEGLPKQKDKDKSEAGGKDKD